MFIAIAVLSAFATGILVGRAWAAIVLAQAKVEVAKVKAEWTKLVSDLKAKL